MPISDWDDMMPDTITVSEFISDNSYGESTYGSPVGVQCRLTFEPTMVLDSKGKEVVSKATCWLNSTTITFDPNDKFVSSNAERLFVLTSMRIQDEDGTHHLKIFFK